MVEKQTGYEYRFVKKVVEYKTARRMHRIGDSLVSEAFSTTYLTIFAWMDWNEAGFNGCFPKIQPFILQNGIHVLSVFNHLFNKTHRPLAAFFNQLFYNLLNVSRF